LALLGCGGIEAGGGVAAPSPPAAVVAPFDCTAGDTAGAPQHLRCTGLYASWERQTIDPANRAYAPAVPLWSDGAQKRRWIFLPAGTRIDSSDMDEWRFPVGTRLWKEFSFGGRHVETRLLWKVGEAA